MKTSERGIGGQVGSDARTRVLVAGFSNHMAGTESVIRNYSLALRGKVEFDFLMWEEPSNFPELFDGTGNRYFIFPRKSVDFLGYRRGLNRFFREHGGEYFALWQNVCNYSNIDYLRQAKKCGIPRRALHAHSDSYLGSAYNVALSRANRRAGLALATDRWACSRAAGDFFFGGLGYSVVRNAVNTGRYAFSAQSGSAFRARHGIPGDALVVGSVGQLVERKNHTFLMDVLAELERLGTRAWLLLVGEGLLREALGEKARSLGLDDRVVLAGEQADVAAALSAMDVFAFPSLHEGLPMAVVEAQFNGLPCLVSDQVSDESSFTAPCTFAPLGDAGLWARGVLEKAGTRFVDGGAGTHAFDIDYASQDMLRLLTEPRDGKQESHNG